MALLVRKQLIVSLDLLICFFGISPCYEYYVSGNELQFQICILFKMVNHWQEREFLYIYIFFCVYIEKKKDKIVDGCSLTI